MKNKIFQKIVAGFLGIVLIFFGTASEAAAAPWRVFDFNQNLQKELNALLPFPLSLLPLFSPLFDWWGIDVFAAQNNPESTGIDLAPYVPQTATIFDLWLPGYSVPVYEHEIEEITKTYPQLNIRITSFQDEAVYFQELEKALARNVAPDLFLVNTPWFRRFQADQKLLPNSLPIAPEIFFHPFHSIAQDFLIAGATWGAPLFGKFPVMIVNKALLRDERIFVAGKPGRTWPELYNNLQKFQEYGDSKILPILLGHPEFSPLTFDLFLLLLEQANISDLSQKEAIDALSFLTNFAKPYYSRYSGTEEELFVQGKAAIIFGNESTVERIRNRIASVKNPSKTFLKATDLQLFSLPQFREDQPKVIGEAWGFAVSSQTLAPDLAWSLALHFSTPEFASAHLVKTGFTPLLKSNTSGIFAESAAMAVSGGKWRNLDFEALFRENVLAQFPEDKKTPVPAPSEALQAFAAFFAADDR